jgi:transitional endoplasmic reticulum ATPase
MTTERQEQMDPRRMVASMAKALGIDVDPEAYAAQVVRTGDKIILPEGAHIPEVVEALTKEYEKEKQKVSIKASITCAPWDGAMALQKAITEELGLAIAVETPGGWFSPDRPPEEIEVEVDLDKTISVRWGRFELPTMTGAIVQTQVGRNPSGEFEFVAQLTTVRRWESRARRILDRMRVIAARESIHRGKAFSIKFYDNDGEELPIPTPKFFRFSDQQPLFRKSLENAIDRNVFTPIRHAAELQKMGESLKRGVLFAGQYGVGKTMLASYIAQYAVKHGWTFIYVKDSEELPNALRYAQRYQPVVVFAEDVDRIAGEERTSEVNNLLNQLDGVDSKSAQIMTILTSNHSDKVNAAMRRPGRIDMVLQVLPPDAETITRMVKSFVGTSLAQNADLTGISKVLEGFAPAYIKEACGRARLEALRRTGNFNDPINGDDLKTVAQEVAAERNLFVANEADNTKVTGLADVGKGFSVMASIINKAAGTDVVKKPHRTEEEEH